MKTWNTNITELVEIFVEALISLIPSMEKAHITFNNNDSYDEWDRIADALFNSIIVDALINSSNLIDRNRILFPKYGIQYENYSEFAFIILKESMDKEYLEVMLEFDQLNTPQKLVSIVQIDKNNGNSQACKTYQFKEQEFLLARFSKNGLQFFEEFSVAFTF